MVGKVNKYIEERSFPQIDEAGSLGKCDGYARPGCRYISKPSETKGLGV